MEGSTNTQENIQKSQVCDAVGTCYMCSEKGEFVVWGSQKSIRNMENDEWMKEVTTVCQVLRRGIGILHDLSYLIL